MAGLQTLYKLQMADLERAEAARKLREAEAALGETEELRGARERLQRAEEWLTATRARVREQELELQSLNSKITADEQRLYGGDVRNPKELEGLQGDLRQLRTRCEHLEDLILTGLTEADEGEARLTKARSVWEAVRSKWQDDQARLQATISDLRAQGRDLDQRATSLRAMLPAALLAEYDEFCRKKGGRAIAAIRRGLCEGCRVSVPTGVVQQVRRGNETCYCSSCGRILCVIE